MSKGCIDCKHRMSRYKKPMKCLAGHTILLNEWFIINGDRTRKMGFKNNHSCFVGNLIK